MASSVLPLSNVTVPLVEENQAMAKPDGSKAKQRLMGLDVVRGLTMAVMVLVDTLGKYYPIIDHSPWNRIHLADFVMPWFLFICGVGSSISVRCRVDQSACSVFKRVLPRVFRLFAVGVFVQGAIRGSTSTLPHHDTLNLDLSGFRIMGILQRIALVFVINIAIELFVPTIGEDFSSRPGYGFWLFRSTALRWTAALVFLTIGTILTYGVTPPSSWPGCSDKLTFPKNKYGCSGPAYIDSHILGQKHMYIKGDGWAFDPEGLTTSISAVLTMYYGLHMGRVWVVVKEAKPVMTHWLAVAAPTLVLSGLIALIAPMNKRMWSPSYSLFMCGSATVTYAFLYLVCDAYSCLPAPLQTVSKGIRFCLTPLQMLGTNAILFFVGSSSCGMLQWILEIVTWGDHQQTIVGWYRQSILADTFGLHAAGPQQVAFTSIEIVFWMCLCSVLYKKGIFWKI